MSTAEKPAERRHPRTPRYVGPRIATVRVGADEVVARFDDGRTVGIPLAWSWRLELATPEERAAWRLIGSGAGVHWPAVDEDLSAQGFLAGSPAPRPTADTMRALLHEARAGYAAEGSD